jgi:hypothetical protein
MVFVERVLASPLRVEESRPDTAWDGMTRHVTCRMSFRLVSCLRRFSLVQLVLFQASVIQPNDRLRLRRIAMLGINSSQMFNSSQVTFAFHFSIVLDLSRV